MRTNSKPRRKNKNKSFTRLFEEESRKMDEVLHIYDTMFASVPQSPIQDPSKYLTQGKFNLTSFLFLVEIYLNKAYGVLS